MIGYVTLGTNDLTRTASFYDALLAELGAVRLMSTDRLIVWTLGPNQPALAICLPFDGQSASSGNGTMVALTAMDRATVDKMHAKALALGATDEGAPGPRGDTGFYAGYFRDPDGHKMNFFCF
jgi:predicted lactoylglutathione lyase